MYIQRISRVLSPCLERISRASVEYGFNPMLYKLSAERICRIFLTISKITMASIAKGNRGGIVLIHNGFRYQKNRTRNERIHWRCLRPECRAPLQSNIFDTTQEDPRIQILNVSNFQFS